MLTGRSPLVVPPSASGATSDFGAASQMKSLAALGAHDSLMRGAEFCRAARLYACERGNIMNAIDLAEK